MSLTDDFLNGLEKRKKKKEEEQKSAATKSAKTTAAADDLTSDFLNGLESRNAHIADGDIAPVRAGVSGSTKYEAEGKGEADLFGLDLFQKGAFADGYQFGDVTKTILGTVGDVGVGALTGITSLGEGLVDLGLYGVSGVADLLGGDGSGLREFAAHNVTREVYGEYANMLDDVSVLGDTATSVAEAVGQIAGIYLTAGIGSAAGLGSAGTTLLTTGTMGASGMGSGMGEAYEGGATDGEALAYGLISGSADAASELLFGGLGKGINALGFSTGLSSADDILAKSVASKFKSQFAKNLVEFGIKAGAEGFEEVVAGSAQALGKKLTYMSEEDFSQILADENLFEQFMVGAITSGIAQSGDLVRANKGKTDFITGYNQNEQTVIQKEIDKRISELEADGTKLTKKETAAIEAQVEKDLEKGYISIDTIEEALGGDAYKSYKDTIDREDAIQKEFDTLNKMKQGEMTGEQVDRRNELKQQLEDIKNNSQRNVLKQQLGDEVFGLVNGSRLAESYNERARRSQTFEADVTKYDAKQQAVIQKAIDSGILNNTNRTHEFVDMVAKISADKGVLFDFTNNDKLKNSGFAVDGKTVNGYVTKDGITLNINSAKSLNSVVGHEIAHVLEGTDLYTELQNTIVEYAKSKGDYQGRYDALTKLYENVKDANIDAELTADLVGDYLFSDENFIRSLSTNNRNVFQKVYDEVKYLVKVATAGSKEARQLEKVKRAFDKAYREAGKNSGDTKYSLSTVEAVQPTSDKWSVGATTDEVRAAHPTLYAVDETATEKRNPTQVKGTIGSYRTIYNFLQNEGFNGTILDASSGLGYGTKAGIEEYGFHVEDIEPYPDKNYRPKYTDYSTLDKQYDVVISNAVLNVLPQDQRDALVVKMGELLNDGGRMFINVRGRDVLNASGKIAINEGNMEYFIPRTEKTGSYQKGFTKPELVAYLQDALGEGFTVEPTNMFGAVSAIVTKTPATKYSLSDSDGKQLSKGQQEYFKNSKMRDENGNLKVMYHGSRDAGFHIFEQRFSDDDTSFFFVDRNDVATSYSGTSETYEARTIRTPDDFINFLKEIGEDDYEVTGTEESGYFVLDVDGDTVAESDNLKDLYTEFCDYMGIGYGDANYKVYLNLTNPLVVDAEGRNWDNVSREFSQEIYDRYKSLTAEEKAALHDLAGWGEFGVFDDGIHDAVYKVRKAAEGIAPVTIDENTRLLSDAFTKLADAEPSVSMYDIFSIAEDNFSELTLEAFAVQQMNTRAYAQRAKEQGYDGVIFKNIVDVGGYGNGSEGAATVAVAFDSNQIKSVANQSPTKAADIRYSLSDTNYSDAVSRGDTEAAQMMVDEAAEAALSDSAIRGKDGKLLPVYHGTHEMFNVFDTSIKGGVNGTAEGYGIYTSANPEVTSAYGDRQIKMYANITKPATSTKMTITPAKLAKLIEDTCKRQAQKMVADGDYDNATDALRDTWVSDYVYTYDISMAQAYREVAQKIMQLNDSDMDIIQEVMSGMAIRSYGDAMEFYRKSLTPITGFDGIWTQWEDADGNKSDIILAFESSQLKQADAVTYDDNGNVIPLSERFNAKTPDIRYSIGEEITNEQNQYGLDAKSEVSFSLSNDTAYMDKAITANNSMRYVESDAMAYAKAVREQVAARLKYIADKGLVGLPEDIEGNTYIANSSYDGTEENTTICPRSLASEAFVDAVSEYLGRPLTVEEQIYISQDLQGRSLTPECTYCYVATDRKAYRAFLGDYIKQRDSVLQKVQENPNADVSRNGELYKEFLNGRKDTNPMYDRFKMWVDSYKNGTPMIDASHLANINRLMGDINSEFGAKLKPQIVDAMKYAQSASWAKKRVNYVAYNGHILNWKQDRINKLNSHYGLRMFSFSDFHPAFVLENMQMITDASVRGLKMLGYTKDTDFVDIFAPSGMNINVSTFGFESGGNVYENNIIGAEWEKAKALREQYPNVGITFVATNDTLVNWALDQDWIDVVIPYHLVRTGAEVAKAFNYTNYTSESADTKDIGWTKGTDKKYIAPTEHNNDKATYLAALQKNHLKPRFERFIDNPNYMKLVNECRQPASQSKPVQPVFNESAAMTALAKLEVNGYYQPIGGSVDRMYEIAAEVAEDMTNQLAPVMSLSDAGAQQHEYNKLMEFVQAKDVAENAITENIAPTVAENATVDNDLFPDDPTAPVPDDAERLNSLTEAPGEVEAPYFEENEVTVDDPFYDRDYKGVGNRKVKAYQVEHPEVKPFFKEAALGMLGDLRNTTKGERWYNDDLYYDSNGEQGFSGTQRFTTDDIADLLDNQHYTYAQIESGLNAIIEGVGNENNAVSKRIEFMLNNRLLYGYTDIDGTQIPPNQGYINLLNEKQVTDHSTEEFDALMEVADQYAPPARDIAPVSQVPVKEAEQANKAPTQEAPVAPHPAETANKTKQKPKQNEPKIAKILTEEPQVDKKKGRLAMMLRKNFVDDFSVFEDLAIKKNNRELQAKASFMRSAESRAQWMIGNGTHGVKSLNDIKTEVDSSGKTQEFYEYLYHAHNVDRMSLETNENRIKREGLQERFKGYGFEQIKAIATEWIKRDTPADAKERIKAAREYIEAIQGANKPVFGKEVTADVSREAVKRYEAKNPEFKAYAKDVYKYMEHLRSLLVENDVISKETADLWQKMYPHYVPIRRDTETGLNINVPLDSRKTGVNAPVKRAKGGNSDILPLFDTMAMRTEQTFRAIARNNFGLELKDTLGTVIGSEDVSNGIDETFEGMDAHEELLKKGKDGQSPTFTVFENGKRVTFEITDDMYEALKPKSEGLSYRNKALGTLSDLQRGLLTQYNPFFMVTNAAKDAQDVLINSQHPGKTYANLPVSYKEILGRGKWYREYMENGGDQNTYFDRQKNTFTEEVSGIKRVITMPLKAIDAANSFIEMAPRLAEYIASRKGGRSIEVSMLDAARVTTDFSAGGDVTKMLNRNGATFLNASVQGAAQQVRNIREANAQGLKGWAKLAAKVVIAGIPAMILNNLLWDDDEEYEELSDYVKRDYYVVGKLDDGTFIRIPKGRTVSVIQNAFEQMNNLITGDDEADLGAFLELVVSNLAPNNPLDNNVFAPLIQAFGTEKTWYGEDLIPSRLQDLPAAEQYDESTDKFSRWLGEVTAGTPFEISPIKANYLLNQYSGGIGDVVLPMLTPEAESGDDSILGNILAPLKDKFTTDGTMNNQNVSDFYDTMDELKVKSNAMDATDEDLLKYKYMSVVNTELSELYQQKREIQNSDLSDAEKYEQVQEIQAQIVDQMREALSNYDTVNIQGGNYVEIGGYHFDKDEDGKWWKINEEQLAKQQEVTEGLGITPSEYWRNRTEYNFAYEKPEQYALSQAVGGYDSYKSYTSDLWDIKADKDEDGKSIIGSRKEKVIDYINEMDADYGTKIILFKNEYNADDTYNYEIIDYLNSRDDISYEQMETILKYLGFEVDSDGNITWD